MATCQRTITASFVKKAGHISDVLDFRFRILLMLLCPYNYKQTSGRSSYHVAQRLTLDVVTLEGRTMSSSAYCLHHDHHSRGYPPSPASPSHARNACKTHHRRPPELQSLSLESLDARKTKVTMETISRMQAEATALTCLGGLCAGVVKGSPVLGLAGTGILIRGSGCLNFRTATGA